MSEPHTHDIHDLYDVAPKYHDHDCPNEAIIRGLRADLDEAERRIGDLGTQLGSCEREMRELLRRVKELEHGRPVTKVTSIGGDPHLDHGRGFI